MFVLGQDVSTFERKYSLAKAAGRLRKTVEGAQYARWRYTGLKIKLDDPVPPEDAQIEPGHVFIQSLIHMQLPAIARLKDLAVKDIIVELLSPDRPVRPIVPSIMHTQLIVVSETPAVVQEESVGCIHEALSRF